MERALGLIECRSLARGAVVTDAMLKTAQVRLLCASAVSPGKLLIGIEGEVAPVEAAMAHGLDLAGDDLEDALFIPRLHAQVADALFARAASLDCEALGIVETVTVAAGIRGADASAKSAAVELVSIRLGAGIGGKAVYYVTGSVADVQAAVDAGVAAVNIDALVRETAVIPSPHPDFAHYMAEGPGRSLGISGMTEREAGDA